jgi:N-acetylneuraminic acid mutarotase
MKKTLSKSTLLFLVAMLTSDLSAAVNLQWSKLPPVPDSLGLGGHFGGTSSNALLVAGGSNFPGKMPWEGGQKAWYDTVFVLDATNGTWRAACKLPRPLGYGVSVSAPSGLYCIGGSEADRHVREVLRIVSTPQGWKCEPLAQLPKPLAYSCGALVGNTIYIAGGTLSPDATEALNLFLALDLNQAGASWRELEPCPGRGRMLAVAASVNGRFYLAGGASLAPDADGKPVRTYLKDTYCFRPGNGWTRLEDMPYSAVAAPTPAPVVEGSTFLIIGGDDGSQANFQPKDKHPGFPKRILAFDTDRNCWTVAGETPVSRATLPAVTWQDLIVLPSGEARPGVRSSEVWSAIVKPIKTAHD